MVASITTLEEFERLVLSDNDAAKSLAVVDFTASWCGPCQRIAPDFAKLAESHKDVRFYKVDVDKNRATAQREKIRCMPTFKFYKNGTLFHVIQGADIRSITQAVVTYKQDDAVVNEKAIQAAESSMSICSIL